MGWGSSTGNTGKFGAELHRAGVRDFRWTFVVRVRVS